MTGPSRESITAAADASRDAMALLIATIDRDEAGICAIRRNANSDHVAQALAAFITYAIDDRDELLGIIASWRQIADDFEEN